MSPMLIASLSTLIAAIASAAVSIIGALKSNGHANRSADSAIEATLSSDTALGHALSAEEHAATAAGHADAASNTLAGLEASRTGKTVV